MAIRVAVGLGRADPPYLSDPSFYRLQAMLIAQGHGFSDPFIWVNDQRLVPTAYHPPLFSTYLAAVYGVGLRSLDAARIANAVVGTTTVVLVGLLGRRVAGPRVGLIAAAIAALTPNLWVSDVALASESLGAALVALTLLFTYRILDQPRYREFVGLGISIGLAGLTRPETLTLVGLIVVPLAWRTGLPPKRRLSMFFVSTIATIAVIAPWMYRSATVFDDPVLFSTNGAATIGFANCDSTYFGSSMGSWLMTCPLENQELGSTLEPSADEAEVASARLDQGLRYVKQHPTRLLTQVVWARIGRSWSLYHPFSVREAAANEAKTRNEMVAGVIALWISLAFAVGGWIHLRRQRAHPAWPLLMPCVVVTITSVLEYGTPRFRVVAEPGIAVLAAVGIAALVRFARDEREAAPTRSAGGRAPAS